MSERYALGHYCWVGQGTKVVSNLMRLFIVLELRRQAVHLSDHGSITVRHYISTSLAYSSIYWKCWRALSNEKVRHVKVRTERVIHCLEAAAIVFTEPEQQIIIFYVLFY